MITLIPLSQEPDAEEILYEMLRERSQEEDPYVNISHRALPSFKDHVHFVRKHPYQLWFLLHDGNGYVGQVLATRRNEIGVIILRAHRGKGHGTEAVRAIMTRYKPLPAVPSERVCSWLANINPLNGPSIRMFSKLGFTLKQQTYELKGGTP